MIRLARPRVAVPVALVGVGVAAFIVAAAVPSKHASAAPTLVRLAEYDWTTSCLSGVAQAAFGVDMFRLQSPSATATVTAVELAGVQGQMKLTHALLVPYGGITSGFPWGSPGYARAPGWRLRQALPAHVHYAPPQSQGGDRARWQVMVDVTIGGDSALADYGHLTYTAAGRTYHVDGQDRHLPRQGHLREREATRLGRHVANTNQHDRALAGHGVDRPLPSYSISD